MKSDTLRQRCNEKDRGQWLLDLLVYSRWRSCSTTTICNRKCGLQMVVAEQLRHLLYTSRSSYHWSRHKRDPINSIRMIKICENAHLHPLPCNTPTKKLCHNNARARTSNRGEGRARARSLRVHCSSIVHCRMNVWEQHETVTRKNEEWRIEGRKRRASNDYG